MVYYPRPKYVKKGDLRNAAPFGWSDLDKRTDQVARHATCLRCAQGIANQKKICNKPEERRCEHCADGNRGGCDLLPRAFFGRVNRLYQLRRKYDAAVTRAATPKTSPAVRTTGVKLARAQRTFNLELQNRRRLAARSGAPIGVATQNPTTTPQFLSLILAEQRNLVSVLGEIAGHLSRMAAPPVDDDDDDDDDDVDDRQLVVNANDLELPRGEGEDEDEEPVGRDGGEELEGLADGADEEHADLGDDAVMGDG